MKEILTGLAILTGIAVISVIVGSGLNTFFDMGATDAAIEGLIGFSVLSLAGVLIGFAYGIGKVALGE